MFFITFSNLWSFSFFFLFTYLTLLVSFIIYLTPILNSSLRYTTSKTKNEFFFLNSVDILFLLITPLICLFLSVNLWVSPTTSAWFGHLIVTSFQNKMNLLIIINFSLTLGIFSLTSYFTSREIYDFTITIFNFFYWIVLLFFSNTIFTTIFIIEVISTLIFLLLITSTFSSSSFYRNLNLSFGHLFQQSTPFSYLQSILYFFWISLLSSLNLFLFVLFFYIKLFTFDWYLLEHLFTYYTNFTSLKNVITLGLIWFIFTFCIFIKCGIAPLYIWKPTFFKGIPYYTIFIYICFFYFFLFLFIIHLLTSYFSGIFYYYSFISLLFISIGLITLLVIICESFYLKAFLAISSILNSLFVILALTVSHKTDIFLWF